MESIEKGDDDAGLKSLIDLAESTPKFLRPQLDQLIGACIDVYKNTNQVCFTPQCGKTKNLLSLEKYLVKIEHIALISRNFCDKV